MTDADVRSFEVPMSMFSELELVAINKAAENYFNAGHEAIAFMLGQMSEREVLRRATNREDHGNQMPVVPWQINANQWSDNDIARAVLVCWGIGEHTRDAKMGELIDVLGEVFVQIAAERLMTSGDARNAIPFSQRNKRKDPGYDSPDVPRL